MLTLPVRKRLLFWILRAYFRRWLKTLLIFFVLGFIVALTLIRFLPKTLGLGIHTERIGVVGSFTIENLPIEIQNQITQGLTKIQEDGSPIPALASSWNISEDGKVYTLKLRDNIFFSDGKKVTTRDVNYNFSDAKATVLDDNTIEFTLNEPYTPFLIAVSRPIFKKGLVGVGPYKVGDIKLNGPFITSLTLEKTGELLTYRFYPTEKALKTALILGEVDIIKNLYNIDPFQGWPNLEIKKEQSAGDLVAIFFNTREGVLSQKNIRQALVYALPDELNGEPSALSPLSFKSFAYQGGSQKFLQNKERAKELLGDGEVAINLKVDEKLEDIAKRIAASWEEIGVKTNIELVGSPPQQDFQAFLGIMKIPADPDQYVLWHSTQNTNITGFASAKIDKLLEDGRKTQDQTEREKIYADFQKYLVDDAPAAFLYYPTVYTVKRK